MGRMFQNCSSLVSLNLSSFSTENVTDFDYMFAYNENLLSLDMSSFNTLNSNKFKDLFEGCYNLTVTLVEEKCHNIISSIPDYVKINYVDTDFTSFFQ
jgi:surface protein